MSILVITTISLMAKRMGDLWNSEEHVFSVIGAQPCQNHAGEIVLITKTRDQRFVVPYIFLSTKVCDGKQSLA
jgi:hypothetical protein